MKKSFIRQKEVYLSARFTRINKILLFGIFLLMLVFTVLTVSFNISISKNNLSLLGDASQHAVDSNISSFFSRFENYRRLLIELFFNEKSENIYKKENLELFLNGFDDPDIVGIGIFSPTGESLVKRGDIGNPDILLVSPNKKLTLQAVKQSGDDRHVPICTSLNGKGFLYVLWKPSIAGQDNTGWTDISVFSKEGLLIDSNDSQAKNMENLSEGLYHMNGQMVYVKRINLPDMETEWWFTLSTLNSKMYIDALKKVIPVFIVIPVVFMFIFLPFARIKKDIVEDLSFLTGIIKQYNENEVININTIDNWKQRSKEMKELGGVLFQMSRKINASFASLRQQAGFDLLTGLPNRKKMMEQMEKLIRDDRFFHLFFMDLDGFKPINDNLGHDVGDLILKEVGLKLSESIRGQDFICRWGGDEFVILITSNVSNFMDQVVARFRHKLSEINVNEIAGRDDLPVYRVSISIGRADFIGRDENGNFKSSEELIKIADDLMYEDKERRRVKV